MEKGFKILAVAFAVAAAVFLWQENMDAVFLTGVLAAVSFFLSIRFAVKKRLAARSAEHIEDPTDDPETQ